MNIYCCYLPKFVNKLKNIQNEPKSWLSMAVEPRVSGHLCPIAKHPDTRECPDMRDSKRTPICLVEIIKLAPLQQNLHR